MKFNLLIIQSYKYKITSDKTTVEKSVNYEIYLGVIYQNWAQIIIITFTLTEFYGLCAQTYIEKNYMESNLIKENLRFS
jgi:hypothetical protein